MTYIIGHPIRHATDFYGRSQQVARFFEIIDGSQAQSVSLLGLRRAGKTSFLQYVAHPDVMAAHLQQPQKYALIYLDVSASKSPTEFYQRLLAKLRKTLGETDQINLWRSEKASMYDVEATLCQHPHRRVILLLDEFDQLRTDTFNQDFLTELRAMSCVFEYDLACVTASYWDLYRLGASVGLPPTSPFYNIFYPTPIYMNGLEATELSMLVREPAAAHGIIFSEEDIADIVQSAGTLPFFLQATAAKWFRARRSNRPLSYNDAILQLTTDLAPYFTQWWRQFSDCEREVLTAVSHNDTSPAQTFSRIQIQDTEKKLTDYGLLTAQSQKLNINGDLFQNWLTQYAGQVDTTAAAAETRLSTSPQTLQHILAQSYNIEELQTLCFRTGLDYEELAGHSKSAKIRDLIDYWQRRGQLHRLVAAVRQERGYAL